MVLKVSRTTTWALRLVVRKVGAFMPKLQIQLLIELLPGEPNEPFRFSHEENYETETERLELLQAIHLMCIELGVRNPFAQLGDKGNRLVDAARAVIDASEHGGFTAPVVDRSIMSRHV